MGAFLTWVVSAFGGLFKLWGVAVTQRSALVFLYLSLYTAMVIALASAVTGLFTTIQKTAPQDSFLSAGLSLLPSNAGLLIGALGAAHIASQLFIWKSRLLKIKVTTK